MADSYENDDECGGIYRKSLLYLIHHALEVQPLQPILGLERCVRAAPALKTLFGIGAAHDAKHGAADVVWADNGVDRGRSASRARTHGGFDDDPATMGSVVRRVLGKADADRIVELPALAPAGAADPWRAAMQAWPFIMPDLQYGKRMSDYADKAGDYPDAQAGMYPAQPPLLPGMSAPPQTPAQPGLQLSPQAQAAGGRRIALCVGIDSYPTAPLGGCVNDARGWAAALTRLDFAPPRTLFNGQATREAIVRQLNALVADSRAGDVIVFQYAGHGTSVPDLDGDEKGGDTAGTDEAMCPYDFADGELLVDDDLRAIFQHLPAGVNLSCFFDCCYSGTITRVALGPRPAPPPAGARARYIEADSTLLDKYRARRQPARAVAPPLVDSDPMREVVFSACLSSEVAHERNGQGDFSRYALQVLAQGIAGLSNGGFADRVTQAFGAAPSQHAKLYSSDLGRALPFLRPLQRPLQQMRPRQGIDRRVGVPGRNALETLSAPARIELATQLARTSQLLTHYY